MANRAIETGEVTCDEPILNNLDFGQDSAESDRRFLSRVFLPTSSFERIRTGKKHLVLGRKGSGKTAICLTLYDKLEQQGTKVSLITPRDLSKFKMSMLEKGSLNASEASLLSWMYTFLAELSLYIVEMAKQTHGRNYLTWPNDVKRVRKFLAGNVDDQASWLDKVLRVVGAVRKLGLKVVEVEVEPDSISKKAAGFYDQLDDIVGPISTALASLTDKPVYILVDRVDEVWDPDVESSSLIVGLLRASKEIREQINLVNVIVFLRSDIFDSLQFQDSDHFHSFEERIIWDRSNLKELVAVRAQVSTGLGEGETLDEIWTRFFPPKIKSMDSFEYLLKYTLMRPRDLIQFCNLCRDEAQDSGHSRIESDDISRTLTQYSKWKLKDLRDEYQVQYPFLEKVFLGVFQHSTARLSRQDIAQRIELVKGRLTEEFSHSYFEPLDNLLQVLYNIGFLGALKGNKVLYSFLGDIVVIPYIMDFEIHQAFRPALEIELDYSPAYYPRVESSETVVVGARAVAVGASAVAVGGDVHGDIIAGAKVRGTIITGDEAKD